MAHTKQDYTDATEHAIIMIENDERVIRGEFRIVFAFYLARMIALALLSIAQEIRMAAEPKIRRE